MDSIYLVGEDAVRAGGYAAQNGGQCMLHAAGQIDESLRNFIQRFDEQIERLATILEEDRQKRGIL